MISNTANYKVGDHLLLLEDGLDPQYVLEVELLQKIRGWIQVRVLTERQYVVSGARWLSCSKWSVCAKLPKKQEKISLWGRLFKRLNKEVK